MSASATPAALRGLRLIFGRRRLRFTLGFSLALGLLIGLGWDSGLPSAMIRTATLGLAAMAAFGLIEQWPQRLPSWLARWVLQVLVLVVALVMPLGAYLIYRLSTEAGAPPFWKDKERIGGFFMFVMLGLLIAPWVALAALVRQKDALARHQALSFALERSELERQAINSRLRLLQAQVEPHFLFNTLANVRELVESGSARAASVLGSLIAYLRAAVPRLHEAATTLGQELDLVRAYLELMQMRMPDRLHFTIEADAAIRSLSCPPMTLLTLVENAVRHGIDPSEDGGHIAVRVQVERGRCIGRVVDSGRGLASGSGGLGTGLSTLRERLQLAFGGDTALRIWAVEPRGVCAEVEFPARWSTA